MSSALSLQEKITVLSQQFGNDSTGLRHAVDQLVQAHKLQLGQQTSYQSAPSASTSANPSANSTSVGGGGGATGSGQATPPVQAMSSRGRPIRASQPYGAAPTTPLVPSLNPRSSTPSSHANPPRVSSSLNPHAYRAPTRVPLSNSALPVPPLSRVSEDRFQAMYTTYPARMRLGVSPLMQPNYLAAAGNGSTSTPGGAERGSSGIGNKRVRTAVNYAEIEGGVGEEEEGGMVPKRALGLLQTGAGAEKAVWGDGKSYLGVLPPGDLVVVQQAKLTKYQTFTEDQLEEQSQEPAVLVPIQIDIDVDTFKIRDAFVWNINEKLITPEAFAKIFCEDLDIPATWAVEIARQINEQCEEQTGVAEIAVRSEEDELNEVEKDLRVVLNLDVQIGTLHLVDRVEWDLSSPLSPELFATLLVRDLALSSNAAPLIAHAIHEELFKHKKNCLEMGLVGESADLYYRRRGARVLEGVWREWSDAVTFGPRCEVMSLDEMDRVEADRERAIRRAKRDRVAGSRTARRR